MSFLEIRNVHKRFGANEVLRGINLTVEEHQVVCLIGPSGCGKSTLLRCINGLEEIQEGEIRLHGDRITGPGVDLNALRRDVGIVFQSFNLFPHMTVLQNITLAPTQVLRMPEPEARAKALALLKRIGLEHKAQAYPDQLSGGQQQRVAIARALAMEPMLLLLDEITSALDPELVSEVLNLLRELAREGMTMILATHEMGFAREVASKVCFMYGGVVHEEGPPEQIFSNPQRERTQQFLASIIEAGRL
ncbi:amino acid ABC transporter ATP-binding protein [Meiothermus taiwanensis]|uniref:Glutamine transport ATP-binding protein GlnQ n=2 Tax=Meiothermus taiwanensis TaxID=172827 RepID=A0A399E4H9_9DEIN|nr:amino acid ABC transporter ATP-binding protein [Meiothermus taiwanensis]AWR85796.1 ABC transporter related protein [Meiothermus taiwanensis WR-220]KZK16117.1 peptide ABC transporter ATP-binding protein [Meiothermus taiwanensis]RIH77121.1 Glutamine transport ATP-binding protein GlnQ [Meiothermus taiwanensis]